MRYETDDGDLNFCFFGSVMGLGVGESFLCGDL